VEVALLVAAAVFAVAAGANDGSSILAAGIRVPGLRPGTSIVVLLLAVALGPLFVFGTGVATTLAHRLVRFGEGDATHAALLVGVLTAIAVVFALTRAGVPTSLTLALVGALTGSGWGAGLPVNTTMLVTILVAGVLAPVLAGGMGWALAQLVWRLMGGVKAGRRAQRWHIVAYTAQCAAYAANGAQKMVAVFAVVVGAGGSARIADPWWLALGSTLLFGAGVLVGLRRVTGRLGRGIFRVQLRHTLVAEVSSSAIVITGGLVGVPLTMSQAVTGALVGAGASESPTRVRWPAALRMVGAWLITLPAAMGLAAAGGAVAAWVS